MRIPSGTTDQYVYFVAVDATDLVTRETNLSAFTVYRSRNGGTATIYTGPTISQLDATNMPGVYKFLLDEDMTLDSGDDSQEYCFHITCSGMAPVTRVIEIYRPETTLGETLTVASGVGHAAVQSIVANALTASALATDAVTEIAAGVWDRLTSALSTASSIGKLLVDNINATIDSRASQTSVDTIDGIVDTILVDTGTDIPNLITGLNDLSAAEVNAEVDQALSDYDGPTNTEMVAAFTEIKGATWSASTDTLEQIRDNSDAGFVLVDELWKLAGLDISNPMTVTPTTRVAGSISQTITGNGVTTSTVTRD